VDLRVRVEGALLELGRRHLAGDDQLRQADRVEPRVFV
jgi:hypothetical protein